MPAPRRAILADISDLNLDPTIRYDEVSKSGKLVPQTSTKHDAAPIFASVQKHEKKVEEKKEANLQPAVASVVEDVKETSTDVMEKVEPTLQLKEIAVEKEVTQEIKDEKTVKSKKKKSA